MSDLGMLIKRNFDEVAGKRANYEDNWLSDLRQYKGIYDPEVKAKFDKNRSRSFIRETRTKVRTLDARLLDLLFPANGEKNWGIEVTPNPSIPSSIEEFLIKNITGILIQSGEKRPPNKEEMNLAIRTYSTEACNKMSQVIDDQLSEIKYRSVIRDTVHSGHLYGTGWLKGPLVDQIAEKHWEMQTVEDGSFSWVLTDKVISVPYAEFKPIWNCYPDLSVTDISLARFMCERHTMPRHKLIQLSSRSDFNSDIIKQYMLDNIDGNAKYSSYETELYQLKENNTVSQTSVKGSYELIEYWGYIAGEDLLTFDNEGVSPIIGSNTIIDFAVNIWILDNEVIKLAINPISGLVIPYHVYYFDKDESSIFGEGIPSIMRDPQRLVNASVRAMIDNAAHCAGPQYEINVDLLSEGEDPTDIGAFKVWLRTGRDADIAGKEVVRVKTIASYTPEFINLYSLFTKFGDEVTIIPRYMQGDTRVSGAGRTASGLSMLMGQANIGLSDLVKMFDDGITKPFISGMYNWNMEFNEDQSIKGDMKVVARGSSALMAKEIRAQQIQTFLQMTLNPEDVAWVKRGNLLRQWAKSTDIGDNEAVYTEEEYQQRMEERRQMAMEIQAQGGGQGGQEGQGAGYNQLESLIKQLEDGMKMIADKVSGMEQFIMQSINSVRREKLINQSQSNEQ